MLRLLRSQHLLGQISSRVPSATQLPELQLSFRRFNAGPMESHPWPRASAGSSCQTSLGRLAVELKRSWFNMDFLPWSLEWSQVIGIKSDKGSARCSLGRFRRANRCPCNKMMLSSMLQYLRLGERPRSRGLRGASKTHPLEWNYTFFLLCYSGCDFKPVGESKQRALHRTLTSMASKYDLSCLHSFQYLVHARQSNTSRSKIKSDNGFPVVSCCLRVWTSKIKCSQKCSRTCPGPGYRWSCC